MNISDEILNKINAVGLKYPGITKISLFGSRARGDNTQISDIDLAVYFLSEPNYSILDDIDNIDTLLKIDVTIMTDTLDKTFLANIAAEEVFIYMRKFKNKLSNFTKAVNSLEAAVNQVSLPDFPQDILRDGLIQRFEFCYELAWKTLREYLIYSGVAVQMLPRIVFRAAYQHGVISNEQTWLNMIKDRNLTSHEYNEQYANTIALNIKRNYYPEFKKLLKQLNEVSD